MSIYCILNPNKSTQALWVGKRMNEKRARLNEREKKSGALSYQTGNWQYIRLDEDKCVYLIVNLNQLWLWISSRHIAFRLFTRQNAVLNPTVKSSIPKKVSFIGLDSAPGRHQTLEQLWTENWREKRYQQISKSKQMIWVRRTLINDKQCVYRFGIDVRYMENTRHTDWNGMNERAL